MRMIIIVLSGHVVRACWWSFGMFSAVSFISFNICMREEREKMAVLQMNRMKHVSEAPDPSKLRSKPKATPSTNTAPVKEE